MNKLPSKTLEKLVYELSRLPGIGKNTALRLALHIIKQNKDNISALGNTILDINEKIHYCSVCKGISDEEVCSICSDNKRDESTICVVENIKDVLSIENTQTYNGKYHILSGVISPMDGIGPQDINIESLIYRIRESKVDETIMALPTTIEGDTTILYIYKKIQDYVQKITTLARGVSIGDDLEYIDSITLGRSIADRQIYKEHITNH